MNKFTFDDISTTNENIFYRFIHQSRNLVGFTFFLRSDCFLSTDFSSCSGISSRIYNKLYENVGYSEFKRQSLIKKDVPFENRSDYTRTFQRLAEIEEMFD